MVRSQLNYFIGFADLKITKKDLISNLKLLERIQQTTHYYSNLRDIIWSKSKTKNVVSIRDLPSGSLIKLRLEKEFFVQYSSSIYEIIDGFIPKNSNSKKFNNFTKDLCLCLICNRFFPRKNDHNTKRTYQISKSIRKSKFTIVLI